VFDVLDGGDRLSEGRIFHKITPGFADGFRVDENGNVWSSAADGVHCIAPDGTKLGAIKTPFLVSNLCFGGRNRSQLFICASHTLYSIYTNRRGAQRP
jgi:gluconolactonase